MSIMKIISTPQVPTLDALLPGLGEKRPFRVAPAEYRRVPEAGHSPHSMRNETCVVVTGIVGGKRRATSAPVGQVHRVRVRSGMVASAVVADPIAAMAVAMAAGAVVGGAFHIVFTVLCCCAALFAAVFATKSGLWWVATDLPLVVALTAILGELARHPGQGGGYQGSKQQAIGLAHGVLAAFPVMATVEVVILAAIVARAVQGGAAVPVLRSRAARQGGSRRA